MSESPRDAMEMDDEGHESCGPPEVHVRQADDHCAGSEAAVDGEEQREDLKHEDTRCEAEEEAVSLSQERAAEVKCKKDPPDSEEAGKSTEKKEGRKLQFQKKGEAPMVIIAKPSAREGRRPKIVHEVTQSFTPEEHAPSSMRTRGGPAKRQREPEQPKEVKAADKQGDGVKPPDPRKLKQAMAEGLLAKLTRNSFLVSPKQITIPPIMANSPPAGGTPHLPSPTPCPPSQASTDGLTALNWSMSNYSSATWSFQLKRGSAWSVFTARFHEPPPTSTLSLPSEVEWSSSIPSSSLHSIEEASGGAAHLHIEMKDASDPAALWLLETMKTLGLIAVCPLGDDVNLYLTPTAEDEVVLHGYVGRQVAVEEVLQEMCVEEQKTKKPPLLIGLEQTLVTLLYDDTHEVEQRGLWALPLQSHVKKEGSEGVVPLYNTPSDPYHGLYVCAAPGVSDFLDVARMYSPTIVTTLEEAMAKELLSKIKEAEGLPLVSFHAVASHIASINTLDAIASASHVSVSPKDLVRLLPFYTSAEGSHLPLIADRLKDSWNPEQRRHLLPVPSLDLSIPNPYLPRWTKILDRIIRVINKEEEFTPVHEILKRVVDRL